MEKYLSDTKYAKEILAMGLENERIDFRERKELLEKIKSEIYKTEKSFQLKTTPYCNETKDCWRQCQKNAREKVIEELRTNSTSNDSSLDESSASNDGLDESSAVDPKQKVDSMIKRVKEIYTILADNHDELHG